MYIRSASLFMMRMRQADSPSCPEGWRTGVVPHQWHQIDSHVPHRHTKILLHRPIIHFTWMLHLSLFNQGNAWSFPVLICPWMKSICALIWRSPSSIQASFVKSGRVADAALLPTKKPKANLQIPGSRLWGIASKSMVVKSLFSFCGVTLDIYILVYSLCFCTSWACINIKWQLCCSSCPRFGYT